ncbi:MULTISPECIES: hypothetical protein [Sphingobacterium]|uniref:Uncharacterized protein n=2 Tax=Sphingobacterium TaxID=28453 RepID=A0ABW5L3Y6_9SPHI|nr:MULTISPECIES: hypothetical protein [Sphingobacterium]MBL1408943.1 hypothetical protein [Sphingobacterium faecale]
METNDKEEYEGQVPEVVKNEPDDKPAGKGIMWAIAIAVVILAIIYFVFFKNDVGFD